MPDSGYQAGVEKKGRRIIFVLGYVQVQRAWDRVPIVTVRQTLFGLLAIVELPLGAAADALFTQLPNEEQELAQDFAPRRRRTFAGGRHALRAALSALGRTSEGPILRDDRGAPILPDGVRGSLSHSEDVACALVSLDISYHLGVDVESIARVARLDSALILTPGEVKQLPVNARDLELALKFSLKESLYKAIDPLLRRYIDFTEVEVWVQKDAAARFSLLGLRELGRLEVEGWWTRIGDRVITSVRARSSK